MKESSKKLLPARLMIVIAILMLMVTAFDERSTTKYLFMTTGLLFLVAGVMLLLARRQK